jgi:hypothetical protein
MSFPTQPTVLKGEGTRLLLGDGGGTEVFADVGGLLTVDGPSAEVESVQTTQLLSAARFFRPSAIPDFGAVDFSIQYVPAAVASLWALIATPANAHWKVVLNDGNAVTRPTIEFSAHLTKFAVSGPDAESPDNLTAECSLKISGPITFGTYTL